MQLAAERGRPYGIVVRRLGGAMQGFGESMAFLLALSGDLAGGRESPGLAAVEAFKIYPDGREELIRNAQILDISLATFREIVAASRTRAVHTTRLHTVPAGLRSFGVSFGLAGTHAASYIVPSLLFEDLSIKRLSGDAPTLPVLRPPAEP